MKPNTLFLFIFLFIVASCKKEEGKPTKPKVTDIYLAGSFNNEAVYWKNGEMVKISSAGQYSSLVSIAVQGDDVYTLGRISRQKGPAFMCWKNGVIIYEEDASEISYPRDLVVNGNGIYILADVAFFNGTYSVYKPTIWKNGLKKELTDGSQNAGSGCMALHGNDLYVAGYIQRSNVIRDAILWKNGNPIQLSNGKHAEADVIAIQGNDVYVAGSGLGAKNNVALVWKNQGVADTLINPNAPYFNTAYVTGIAVNDKDVYVGATDVNIDSFFNVNMFHYVYWKNGVTPASNSVHADTYTGSGTACYYNNSLYVAGSLGGTAGYWKDQEPVYIAGQGTSGASDILIVEH